MAMWTPDELNTFGAMDEIHISSRRADGTLSKPTIIWVARFGDDLYVRSVNGRDAAWFERTQQRHLGRIEGGGAGKDVRFEDVTDNPTLNNQLDAAYRSKYSRYPKNIVDSVVSATATGATLKVVPQS